MGGGGADFGSIELVEPVAGLGAGKRAAWIREARIDIIYIIGIIRKGLGVPAANARPGGARFAG